MQGPGRPAGSLLLAALDAPPEEFEPLLDVGQSRLVRRQSQSHRGQDPADLRPQRPGIVARPVDEAGEVVRVADHLHHRAPAAPVLRALPVRTQCVPFALEVPVQDG